MDRSQIDIRAEDVRLTRGGGGGGGVNVFLYHLVKIDIFWTKSRNVTFNNI